jgi:outer membrane lipoprotein-sorting protein
MSGRHFLRYTFSLTLLISILFLAGCAGYLASKRPLRKMEPAELIQQLQAHQANLNTYQGFALFTAATEAGGFWGALEIRAVNPDSVWIKAEGPFGIDVGLIRLAGRDVLMYSPFGKTAFYGNLDSLELKRLLPVELENNQMALGLQGLLIPNPVKTDSNFTLSVDDRDYVLRLSGRETVWVDPQGPVITRWERRDESGEVSWEWEGKSYQKKGKVRLPQLVKIKRSDPKQEITLRYSHVRTNHKMKSGWSEIKIPEDVHVNEL